MNAQGRDPVTYARHFWSEVLDLPGASRMALVRGLIESRPMLERVPDLGLIFGSPGYGTNRHAACRVKSYAFVYLPYGLPVRIQMGRTSGESVKASWYDPRTGAWTAVGTFANTGVREFTPLGVPGAGHDWVLVLDDASG
jgi:hypothetical protein